MFKRNPKLPQQLRDRRSRSDQAPASPAFSYYTSRTQDMGPRRPDRADVRSAGTSVRSGDGAPQRRLGQQIPLLALIAVGLVCLAKLLLLGTNPKVVLLGKSDVSATYMHTISAYQSAAQKILASSITNHTKITANLDGTASALKKQFPELQATSVTLPLIGNRPIVYVQVAQPSIIVQNAHGDYVLNDNGLVLAQVHTLPSGVPVVVDESASTPVPGRYYLPGSTISFVQTVAYQLNAKQQPVSAFVLPGGKPYELDVRLEGRAYVVRFNLVADAVTQSGAAVATVQQLGTGAPASYIDVRIPGRVYYK